jgi:thiamine-phosphate pyrophosphorylase
MSLAERLRVYFILDSRFVTADPIWVAEQAIAGGATALQLRLKDASSHEWLMMGAQLKDLCASNDVLFVINDRVDIAVALAADGVHLGPHDMSISAARAVAANLLIGGSAGSLERAIALEAEGADYLGCGAIFEARDVKPDASAPRGLDFIESVASQIDVPFVGIGGITSSLASDVIRAGASGVAVVREIGASRDPAAAERLLSEAVARGLDSRASL